jgi:hypothetical protein
MPSVERRTPAKPGQFNQEQWPGDLVVEYGPARMSEPTLSGYRPRTYDVFVGGERIGTVNAARETSHRPVHPGSRLRRDTGNPIVWRAAGSRGIWPAIDHYPGLPCQTRTRATADLVSWWLTGSPETS